MIVLQVLKGRNVVKLKGLMTAMAAMSLVAAPTMAAAAPATVQTKAQPAIEQIDGDNELAGLGGGGIIVAILAAAAVIVGIVIVADSDDKPNSP